jgi:hypothetical protein
MENQVPTKPAKNKRQFRPLPNEAPTVDAAEVATPTSLDTTEETNKYARRTKIGRPTIGRSPNYVETVGLGKLRVLTTNGIQSDVRPE